MSKRVFYEWCYEHYDESDICDLDFRNKLSDFKEHPKQNAELVLYRRGLDECGYTKFCDYAYEKGFIEAYNEIKNSKQ